MLNALFMGWTLRQQMASNYSAIAASGAAAKATQTHSKMEMMGADIERLLMITEALWIMLREAHGYSDEQLIKLVQDIDMRDGKLDGKVSKQPPSTCTQCGRVLARRQPTCLYCGAVAAIDPFKR